MTNLQIQTKTEVGILADYINEDLSIFLENISSALTCLFQESEEYPSYCEYEN